MRSISQLEETDTRTGNMTNLISLQSGTELVDDYRIDRVLGAGGFGITYLADEIALDRRVTIKEYFPSDFAARSDGIDALPKSQDCSSDYQWGLDRFMEEAQTLARFDHPNIVRVYRYFLANNTGYMVLHFEEGQSLKSWLKGLKRAPRQNELDAIITKLLDALELIHQADFLHRDIAPDNIIIRRDGQPVLIDFGSARGEIASNSKTVSALVKPGYSPYEQYAETSRQQGPWTDIYALAATLYHAVTGKRPPDAPSRMVKDELRSASEAAVGAYRKNFLKAIDKALSLKTGARPRSIASWRKALFEPDPVKPGWRETIANTAPASPKPAEVKGGAKNKAGNKARKPKASSEPPRATAAKAQDHASKQSGLLDFLEGLKPQPTGKVDAARKAKAAPVAAAKTPEPLAPIPAAKTGTVGRLLARLRTSRNPIQVKPAAQPEPAPQRALPDPKPPRPRRIRPRRKTKLRPVLFKLFVGVSVASAAVAMQDRLPNLQTSSAALTTASISKEEKAAAEKAEPQLTNLLRLPGHSGGTSEVAFSNNGQKVITAGGDQTIKVWDAKTGRLLKTISSLSGPIIDIAVAGDRVLSAHRNGDICLWNLGDGRQLNTYRRNDAEVWSVAFAGRMDQFVAASHDWKVAMWNVEASSKPLHIFEGHKNAAQVVAFSSSSRGDVLASGSADKTIKLWNPKTAKLTRTYRGHRDFITAIVFSPDGKYMASASLDGNIRVWSTSSRRLYRSYKAHEGAIAGLAFATDNRTLASAGEDGAIKVWDVRRRNAKRTLLANAGKVSVFSVSKTGNKIAVASDDGAVNILEATTPLLTAQK
jgi:serine/threonine protein kinase